MVLEGISIPSPADNRTVCMITGPCDSARGHSIPSPADNMQDCVVVPESVQYQVQLITGLAVVPEGIQYQVQLITGLCGSGRGHSIPSPGLASQLTISGSTLEDNVIR